MQAASPNGQNSDRGIETPDRAVGGRTTPPVPMDRIPTEELKLWVLARYPLTFSRPNGQNSDRGIETLIPNLTWTSNCRATACATTNEELKP